MTTRGAVVDRRYLRLCTVGAKVAPLQRFSVADNATFLSAHQDWVSRWSISAAVDMLTSRCHLLAKLREPHGLLAAPGIFGGVRNHVEAVVIEQCPVLGTIQARGIQRLPLQATESLAC